MRTLIVVAALMLASSLAQAQAPAPAAAPAAAAAAESPSDVIQTAAQGMLNELDKDRAAYKSDPAKINALVNKYLLPHFDSEFSAQLVLGQYWRTASPEQRKRFIDAFYK